MREVPQFLARAGRFACRRPRLMRWLGSLETRALAPQLDGRRVERPIYVTGLARGGTTIMLEFLAGHPCVGTHQYRDFPFVWFPYWWDKAMARAPEGDPEERAHADGIWVTSRSPEAMEEMLWRDFFPHLGDHSRTHVMDASASHPQFERFYADHILKLLLARGRERYAAKGNYNVARLLYILRMFPGARFIIPVREPVAHVGSLIRQHRLFCAAPRGVAEHLAREGHFEFGPLRSPINVGTPATARVVDLWARGQEAEGWAIYWKDIHAHVLGSVRDSALRAAARIVSYEGLCADPEGGLRAVLGHCGLADDGVVGRFAPTLRKPGYGPPMSDAEARMVREICGETHAGLMALAHAGTCG